MEDRLLRMWEGLGSIPGTSRGGAFALTAQPQAGVGWSSGTAPLQALWACPAHPGLGCQVGRAVGGLCVLPLLSPLLEEKQAAVLDLSPGHCPES